MSGCSFNESSVTVLSGAGEASAPSLFSVTPSDTGEMTTPLLSSITSSDVLSPSGVTYTPFLPSLSLQYQGHPLTSSLLPLYCYLPLLI